jgi:RimJ/RimL family protein N-acetyltransferase
MPPAPLETARLRLEPWADEHTELLARLGTMPEVTRLVGPGTTWPREQAEEVAARQREHWAEHGFGWRVAVDRAAGETVGFIALNHAGEGTAGLDPGEFELGWWLDPTAWGKGYAREGARALATEAFDCLRAPSVIARIQPANDASIAVARALGMERHFRTTGRSGETLDVYRLSAPA